MMDTVKVGVIGCGSISREYLEFSRHYPILEVLACADREPERAKQAAQLHGKARACSTSELLDDERIELVVNLTLPATHGEIALEAIGAGKHVYNEKPLAMTPDEGARVLDAAKDRGVRVGCAPDTFLGSPQQTCRRVIDEGVIGRPRSATALMMIPGHEHWHPSPEYYYEPGGGPMLDMGPYYLTALVNLLGPVRCVAGMAGIHWPERTITSEDKHGQTIQVRTPDHVAGVAEMGEGVIVNIVTSFATHHAPYDTEHPVVVYGTEGTLRVPDPNWFDGRVLVRRWDDDDWRQIDSQHTHPGGRSLGVAEMAHAIRHSRPHRASGMLGLGVLQAMHGFLDSGEARRYVELEPAYDRPEMLATGLGGEINE